MKWLFLVNDAPFLSEFFGKMQAELVNRGEECVSVFNSKISEFRKTDFLAKESKKISKIDWCLENYKEEHDNFYGISWKDAFTIYDRFASQKLSFKNAYLFISSLCQFFEYIFEKEKPDIITGEIPSDIFHEAAIYVGKKHGAVYIGLEESKFSGRIDIFDSGALCKRCENNFNNLKYSDINSKEKTFIKDFIDGLVGHKIILGSDGFLKIRFSQLGIVWHYFSRVFAFFKLLLKYLVNRKKYKKFDYESETIIKKSLGAPINMEKRQLNIFCQKRFFDKQNKNDKFFLFPLHYQPESSTMVYATYYNDQINTIKNICFSLPFPYKLYVKEHPASMGLRNDDFYKKIKNLPNAILLSPEENTEDLIKKSSGVIVLTGTIGLESALLGKPTYVLGSAYYSYHPGCQKISGFEDLKRKIQLDLSGNGQKNTFNLEEENYKFIQSYFKSTIKGSMALVSIKKDSNNYSQIVDDLKNIASSIKNICLN